MTIQVAIWVPATPPGEAAKVAVVTMTQGDQSVKIATLKPGEQGQYSAYPGCAITVTEQETST